MNGGKGSSPPIDISSVFEYIKLFSRQLFKETNSKAKTHKTWKKEPKWAWLWLILTLKDHTNNK